MNRVYAYSFQQTTTIRLEGFGVPNYTVTPDNKTIVVEEIPASILSTMCDDWRAAVFQKARKKDPALGGAA